MELFNEVANADEVLAEEIIKVASDFADEVPEEEQLEDFLNDLEEAGVDLDDPEVIEEIENFLQEEGLQDYTVEKTAEFVSEDILKEASGMQEGFETNAAARVMQNYFDRHGVANLGSSYGMSAIGVGSAIAPSADSNVVGGWGRLIGGGNMSPNAVNATSKVSGVLGRVYKDNIRTASDEDYGYDGDEDMSPEDYLIASIEEAAYMEGQTPDEFIQDLAFEHLEELAKQELINQ